MTRARLGAAVLSVLAAMLVLGVAAGSAGGPATDGPRAQTVDTATALVQLEGDPLATSARTKPPKGKKIDFSSSTVRSYRAQLNQLRNEFKQWLRQNAPAARVTGEFDITLNAVAVRLNGTRLGTNTAAPMVQRAEFQGL